MVTHDKNSSCTSLDCDQCYGSDKEIKCRINFAEVDNLVGRILTIIDASVADHEQRKAQKRIFKKEIHDWYYDIERDQHPEFRKMMEYGEVIIN